MASADNRFKLDQLNDYELEPTVHSISSYTFEIRVPIEASGQDADLIEWQRVQIVAVKDPNKWYVDLVTPAYIAGAMKDGRKTGEFARGSYYPGLHRIVVRDLTQATVIDTLEELVKFELVPHYFKNITQYASE